MEQAQMKRRGYSIVGNLAGLALILFLAGCVGATSSIKPVEVGQLCLRSDRAKPVFTAYIDERAAAYLGDAPKGEYDGVVKRVATALAVPRTPIYRRRVRADCYDKAKKVWYNCVKETKVDFSKIKGIARAPKMESARDLAVQICTSAVRVNSPRGASGIRFNSVEFSCKVIQQNYCPVFKASKEFKKKKKALKLARKKIEGPGYKWRKDFCVSQACLPE